MKNIFRALTYSILLGVILVSCDSNDPAVELNASSVLGTYRLKTVNGDAVPYAITNATGTTIVNSGSVVIGEQQSIQVTFTYQLDSGAILTESQTSTWSLDAGKLFIVHPDHGVQYPNNQINSTRIELHSTWYPDIPLKMIFEKE